MMVECISIPTPFQVGDVNAYLIGSTLVDPGPDSEDSWTALVEGLADAGKTPADIERVLITHPHPDHFGLASRLRDEGASIEASSEAADIIGGFAKRLEYEQRFFVPFFIKHGIKEDVARTLVELPEAFLEFAPDVTVDRRLHDGDTIPADDGQLEANEVAGHAPGELIFTFHLDDGHHAIVGDHVLDPITPNPFLQPPPTPQDERPLVLPAYNRSLAELSQRAFDRLYPGHRGFIERPTHRIDQLLRFHEYRTERVANVLTEEHTAAEVMRELFGDLPLTEIFSGMSEAIGHIDVLADRDRVDRIERNDTVRFVLRD